MAVKRLSLNVYRSKAHNFRVSQSREWKNLKSNTSQKIQEEKADCLFILSGFWPLIKECVKQKRTGC